MHSVRRLLTRVQSRGKSSMAACLRSGKDDILVDEELAGNGDVDGDGETARFPVEE